MEPLSALALFAANWRPLLVRGGIALLTGMAGLLWSGRQPDALITVFGAYALADGLAAMTMAVRTRGVRGFGSVLVQGLIGVAAGAVVFTFSAIPVMLPAVMVCWATAKGAVEIFTAIDLRREVTEEWPLPATGALSIIFGGLIMPGIGLDIVGLAWVFSVYAIVLGIFMAATARRLRQLADEMRVT